MNAIAFQHWVRNLGPIGSITLYLAGLLMTAAIWLSQGTAIGSLAGGMFLGLAMSQKAFLGFKNKWADSFLQPIGFIAFVGLYFWKEHALMPADWEPARYYDAVGVMGLLVGFGLAAAFNIARDPEKSATQGTPVAEIDESGEGTQEPVEMTKMRRIATAIGGLALLVGLVLNLSISRPYWISTSDIAIGRHIIVSILDYRSKDNLAYLLASLTQVSVQSKERDGDTVTARITVEVPVVPFPLTPDQANSRAAMRQYNSLPLEQKPYATLTGKLVLKEQGMGWVVTQDTINADPVVLSRAFRSGELETHLLSRPIIPQNFMGIADMASQPFNPLFIMFYAIGLVVLLGGGSPVVIAITSGFPLLLSCIQLVLMVL